MRNKFLLSVVLLFLAIGISEGSQSKHDVQNDVGTKNPSSRITVRNRFPVIPDFIRKISYDVTKTDSEIALISQIETLHQELSGKLSDPELSLLQESQLRWADYYEKETYGLNPANGFVTLTIDGKRKRINAYRENMKAILEGRVSFINSFLSNTEPQFNDSVKHDDITRRIRFYQNRVEYFSEERNRPRVWEGELGWKQFIEANAQFLESIFADDAQKAEMYKMYALKERLEILELQLAALERLRIEVEEY